MPYADKDQQKKAQQDHYLNNKSDYITRNQMRRYERKNWFKSYMSGKACTNCNESAFECLDWHHLDPTKKKWNVSRMLNEFRSKEQILEEISKCILLCANCHRKLHAGTLII